MRYREEPTPWDDGEYNTGYTTPPKSHRTFIALLLIAVIILIGLSTLLGVSNLRLFQQLNQQKAEPTICYSTAESVVDSEFVPIDVERITNESIGFPALAEQEDTLTLREIYIKCSPSVVSITSESRSGNSSGSGVIFSEDGYVVTNYHVIENGESYTVLLADERSQPARLVGSDPTSDLAVLQVNATDLTPAEFGDSDDVYVGDNVVAIGDPLGVEFRGTMTNGIVSAINRNVNVNGRTMNLIQTNAALNSGNSGGPLINSCGQVIGINTIKIGAFTDSAGVEGLGFAIPSAVVKDIVSQILDQGYVSGRPFLGITGERLSVFYQRYYRLPAGLYVTAVAEGSSAADVGIVPGDILLSIDGTNIRTQNELDTALYNYAAGDQMDIVIYRSGYTMQATLTLAELGKAAQTS